MLKMNPTEFFNKRFDLAMFQNSYPALMRLLVLTTDMDGAKAGAISKTIAHVTNQYTDRQLAEADMFFDQMTDEEVMAALDPEGDGFANEVLEEMFDWA